MNGVSGATVHPSAANILELYSNQLFGTVTQVISPRVFNEAKVGYAFINNIRNPAAGVFETPRISLRGYTIGKPSDLPQDVLQHSTSIRNDLTLLWSGRGRHETTIRWGTSSTT